MTKEEFSSKLSMICAFSVDMGKASMMNEKELWNDRSRKQDKLYQELINAFNGKEK